MNEIRDQQYREAAEDLNELLGLKPPILIDLDLEELSVSIKEAANLLEKGDKPKDNTILVLQHLKALPHWWPKKKPKTPKKKQPEPAGKDHELQTTKDIIRTMRRVAPPVAMIRDQGFIRAFVLQELIDMEDILRLSNKLEEGERFYYQKTRLAHKFGVSVSIIEKALKELKAKGFISRELRQQEWEIGGKWRRYRKGAVAYYKLDHGKIRSFLIKLKQVEEEGKETIPGN